jgi:hypothetical protein
MERWLPIPGYEGFYEASDQGRVKSLARTVQRSDGRPQPVPERVLTPKRVTTGRLQVDLYRDGRKQQCQLHRLVLFAFVGPCPEGMEACHSDGDPTNNRLENLRWDTRAGNHADKIQHGTHSRGTRHKMARLTESQVLSIRADARPRREIAAHYGISPGHVNHIKARKAWFWLDSVAGHAEAPAAS